MYNDMEKYPIVKFILEDQNIDLILHFVYTCFCCCEFEPCVTLDELWPWWPSSSSDWAVPVPSAYKL